MPTSARAGAGSWPRQRSALAGEGVLAGGDHGFRHGEYILAVDHHGGHAVTLGEAGDVRHGVHIGDGGGIAIPLFSQKNTMGSFQFMAKSMASWAPPWP